MPSKCCGKPKGWLIHGHALCQMAICVAVVTATVTVAWRNPGQLLPLLFPSLLEAHAASRLICEGLARIPGVGVPRQFGGNLRRTSSSAKATFV